MIKIYKFMPQDLLEMEFNSYSTDLKDKRKKKKILHYLLSAYAYTVYDTGLDKAVAILGFHEYEPRKFDGCIIASTDFDKNAKYAIKMKYLVNNVIRETGAVRVQTVSEDIPALNKWHRFLGFSIEKEYSGFYKNRNFILWSM